MEDAHLARVTYGEAGDTCGLFTSDVGIVHHRMCRDGLACFLFEHRDGTASKQCQVAAKAGGESCIPGNHQCVSDADCMLNPWGEYSCGGIRPWDAALGIDRKMATAFTFQPNAALIIIGGLLLVAWLILVVWFAAARRFASEGRIWVAQRAKYQIV